MNVPVFLIVVVILVGNTSCDNTAPKETDPVPVKKPSSGFMDTLFVEKAAVIYYTPDSIQLEKIRAVTDSSVFGSMMHEYEYMLKNALAFIANAPETRNIGVAEAKSVRFIVFHMNSGDTCIDLDQRGDPVGMFFFHPSRKPVPVDMANISAELPIYFRNGAGD
jgi:hypothetical protein